MEPINYPEGQINTKDLGLVDWVIHGDTMSFHTPTGVDNVVNGVAIRFRFSCKFEALEWKRDHLSTNRVGSYRWDDVSDAARSKITRVLLAEANKLATQDVIAQAHASRSQWEMNRKKGEIEEAKKNLATLEKELTDLTVAFGVALAEFEQEKEKVK